MNRFCEPRLLHNLLASYNLHATEVSVYLLTSEVVDRSVSLHSSVHGSDARTTLHWSDLDRRNQDVTRARVLLEGVDTTNQTELDDVSILRSLQVSCLIALSVNMAVVGAVNIDKTLTVIGHL